MLVRVSGQVGPVTEGSGQCPKAKGAGGETGELLEWGSVLGREAQGGEAFTWDGQRGKGAEHKLVTDE